MYVIDYILVPGEIESNAKRKGLRGFLALYDVKDLEVS